MGAKINKVVTEDFSMKYSAFGNGPKPLIMVPGLSLISTMVFADTTETAYKEMLDEYTIYLMDRREDMPEVYTIQDMARDTAAAVRELGISDAYFFGTSQGGMIIQVIAIEHPELVKKMAIGSSVSSVKDLSTKSALGRWIELAEKGDIHELNMAFSEEVYSEETFRRFKKAISAMDKMVTAEDLRRFIILSKGIKGFDVTSKLDEIKCPVLIIGSKKDRVFDWTGMQKTAEQQGWESYFYEEYSHCVYGEAPDFKVKLKEFFSR